MKNNQAEPNSKKVKFKLLITQYEDCTSDMQVQAGESNKVSHNEIISILETNKVHVILSGSKIENCTINS